MGTSPSKREKGGGQESTPKSGSKSIGVNSDLYKVTVINTGEIIEEVDPILKQLEALKPSPLPILEASEGKRYMVDTFNQLGILSAYQQMLHHSSKNVAENQDALVSKIAPTLMDAHKNMQTVHQIGQELAHFEHNIQSINELSTAVQLAQDQLIHIISFLDQIESLLPPDFDAPNTPKKSPSDATSS